MLATIAGSTFARTVRFWWNRLAQYSSPSSARETCNPLNGKFGASSDPIRKLPPLINRMLTLRAKTRPLRSGARLSRRESDRVLARRDNMREGAGRAS
jgi:hypothetical protein